MTRALLAMPLVAASLAFAACGDDDAGPGTGERDGGPPDASDLPLVDADLQDDAGPPPAIVDVPDTACTDVGGVTVTVAGSWPAESGGSTPTALVAIGARRAALVGGGVVTMVADGSGAAGPFEPFVFGGLAAIGTTAAAAGVRGAGLEVVRYSETGAAGPASLIDGAPPNGYGIGGNAAAAMVVWATSYGAVYARAVGAGPGSERAPFFVRALGESQHFRAAVVADEDGAFAVAFSGEALGGGAYRLGFARLTETGVAARSTTLLLGPSFVRLTGLATTGSGYALLYEGEGGAHLARLDRAGRFAGSTVRLGGTLRGLSIAARGDRVGVLSWRREAPVAAPDGEPPRTDTIAFRAFDASGAPASGSRCFEGPAPLDGDLGGALAAEDAGWVAIRRTREGAVALTRFGD